MLNDEIKDSNITIRVNKKLKAKVKEYAKENETTLTELIESYLIELINEKENKKEIEINNNHKDNLNNLNIENKEVIIKRTEKFKHKKISLFKLFIEFMKEKSVIKHNKSFIKKCFTNKFKML